MKKIELTKVNQKGKVFYVMVADPRIVVKLLKKVAAGMTQEAQRPWSVSKVKKIALYVAGNVERFIGLLPNAPILNITDKLNIETDTETGREYILLPETEEEIASYLNSFEAIDGQHRLLSFSQEFIDPKLLDEIPYEMVFSIFERIGKKEKQEIFMVTNEKQDKVSNNLLRYLRKALNLLGESEAIYDLTCCLNVEDFSPLKGRIIVGAEKINKGYQEGQISKILKSSQTYNKLIKLTGSDPNADEKMAKLISNYLKGWQKVYSVSFKEPGKDTLTKISGLRYVFYLFPEVCDILAAMNKSATVDNLVEIIRKLPEATETPNVFEDEVLSLAFRGEGATVKLAKDHAALLLEYCNRETKAFNVLEGI